MGDLHTNMPKEMEADRIELRNRVEHLCEVLEGSKIPVQKKLLFYMAFRHGYKDSEIGKLLGINQANVGRRLRTILRELSGEGKYKNGVRLNRAAREAVTK